MYVYKITNIINGKSYIGKTIGNPEERLNRHLYLSTTGVETYFYSAIRKYGLENFLVEVLQEASSEKELNDLEVLWIKEQKPEYNMTSGGDGGNTSSSPNYKKSMKLRSLLITGENNPFYGKRHSEETKEKNRAFHQGKVLSEETKLKISNSLIGKPRAIDAILKTSEKNSETWNITFPDGKEMVIKNLNRFCKIHNLDQGNMVGVSKGKYKTSKGFKCEKVT